MDRAQTQNRAAPLPVKMRPLKSPKAKNLRLRWQVHPKGRNPRRRRWKKKRRETNPIPPSARLAPLAPLAPHSPKTFHRSLQESQLRVLLHSKRRRFPLHLRLPSSFPRSVPNHPVHLILLTRESLLKAQNRQLPQFQHPHHLKRLLHQPPPRKPPNLPPRLLNRHPRLLPRRQTLLRLQHQIQTLLHLNLNLPTPRTPEALKRWPSCPKEPIPRPRHPNLPRNSLRPL